MEEEKKDLAESGVTKQGDVVAPVGKKSQKEPAVLFQVEEDEELDAVVQKI